MANEREVYRKVYLRLWRHEEFQKLPDGERVLTLYLVSGPQTNAIGCYHFSPGLACEDLGISMSQLRRRLHAVLTAFGWQHDETRRLMWITSWLKWNRPNGANATKAWQAEIETLPDCEAKRCLRDGIAKLTAKSTGRLRDAIGDAIYDGVATQDQDQEQEQKQDQNQDLCVHTPEQRLWHAWRARSAAAGVVLPIEPRHAEAMKVLEACQKVPDESVRIRALDAFWALDERERARRNIKARTLGYFVMALPDLISADPTASIEREREKFLRAAAR